MDITIHGTGTFWEYKEDDILGKIMLTTSIKKARELYKLGVHTFDEATDEMLEDYKSQLEQKHAEDALGRCGYVRVEYPRLIEGDWVIVEKLYDCTVIGHEGDKELIKELDDIQELRQRLDNGEFEYLYESALAFATEEHRGEKDMFGTDYVKRLESIAESVEGTIEKVVALLQDAKLKDKERLESLYNRFPTPVARAVELLSNVGSECRGQYIALLLTDSIARSVKAATCRYETIKLLEEEDKGENIALAKKQIKYIQLLEGELLLPKVALEAEPTDTRMVDYQVESYEMHRVASYLQDASTKRMSQVLEMVTLLKDLGAPLHVVIAGALYMGLPMSKEVYLGISQNYGKAVVDLIMGLPLNIDLPFDDKAELVEQFRESGPTLEERIIMLAKVITELREYEQKVYMKGAQKVFETDDERLQYERYFAEHHGLFDDFEQDSELENYYWMFQNIFKDVFVEYKVDEDMTVIYQHCDLYTFVLKRGLAQWLEVDELPEGKYTLLTREEAEDLSDDWIDEAIEAQSKGSIRHAMT